MGRRIAPPTPTVAQPFQNRIVGHGTVDPTTLLPHPNNWRLHGRGQKRALRASLTDVGWVQQVIVNATTGRVLDGHLRLETALANREPSIPVVYVELSEPEELVVLTTLDPIGAMAGTDKHALHDLLAKTPDNISEDLHALILQLSKKAGFWAEVEEEVVKKELTDEDLHRMWRTKVGQLWYIPSHTSPEQSHRLKIGDSGNAQVVGTLFRRDHASWLWTDLSGALRSGEQVLKVANAVLEHGASVYIAAKEGCLQQVYTLFSQYWDFLQTLVWVRDEPLLSRTAYQQQHEYILYGWKSTEMFERVWLKGKAKSTVSQLDSPKDYEKRAGLKPIELIQGHLSNSTHMHSVGYDPCMSWGSTLLAAEKSGRILYGLVSDPTQAAVVLERCRSMGLFPERPGRRF